MTHRIAVIGLGGTIAMTSDATSGAGAASDGLKPTRSIESLLPADLRNDPDLSLELIDRMTVGSANLTFAHIAAISDDVSALAAKGCTGVVIVQGTDTIEETAFLLELLTDGAIPVAVTGAMRGASHVSPDGASNIVGSVLAVMQAPAGQGVLVVLNDEVHAARHVRKAHTTALDAFRSGETGPLGRLHEGRVRWRGVALPRLGRFPAPAPDAAPRVAIIKLGFDQDAALLQHLPQLGYRGCVVEAMGAGHAPETLVPTLEHLAAVMPVILCSRAADGAVCERTYGYAGAEMDLLRRGLTPGGGLNPLKARVLLTLCLLGEAPAETFRQACALI